MYIDKEEGKRKGEKDRKISLKGREIKVKGGRKGKKKQKYIFPLSS